MLTFPAGKALGGRRPPPSNEKTVLRSDFASYLPPPAWRCSGEPGSGWAEARGCCSESPLTRPRPWTSPPRTAANPGRFWERSLNTPRPRGFVTWLLNDAANPCGRRKFYCFKNCIRINIVMLFYMKHQVNLTFSYFTVTYVNYILI